MRFLEKFSSVLVLVIFVLVFGMGVLWQKVAQLEKGSSNTLGTSTTAGATPSTSQTPAPVAVTLDQIKGIFGKNVIKFGDATSKALIVEIADPSCPYCHVAAGKDPEINAQLGDTFKLVSAGGTYLAPVPEFKKLVDTGKASFAYVYFPGHGNGEIGMKALYCAYDQGKFWEAHDLIMSNAGYNLLNNDVKNDKTKSSKVVDLLKGVIDAKKLQDCLDSGKYDSRLTEDTTLSQSLSVQGTPDFYVNATNFAGAYNYNDMQSAVTAALQ